jgi:hypothetical protein
MTRRIHQTTSIRQLSLFGSVVVLGVALLAEPSEAAKPTKKPAKKAAKLVVANGKSCTTLEATSTASSGTFTCVQMKNNTRQWWSVGTIQNPIRLRRIGTVNGEGSGKWEITVMRRIDDDTARILAIESNNRLANEGTAITSLEIRVKSLGTDAETSIRATAFEVTTATRQRVERWDLGQAAPEDCWSEERVANGVEKVCQFPFEITPGTELAGLRLAVRPTFGEGAPLYFDTATNQPPLR